MGPYAVRATDADQRTPTDGVLDYTVTLQHIRDGLLGNAFMCAHALAIKEATGENHVIVTSDTIIVGQRHYVTSQEVRDWISRYEIIGKHAVSPGRFIVHRATDL